MAIVPNLSGVNPGNPDINGWDGTDDTWSPRSWFRNFRLAVDVAAARAVLELVALGSTVRVVTANPVTVASTDDVIVVKKIVSSATSVVLPSAVTNAERRLTIIDGKGDSEANPITMTSAAGTINGQVSNVIDLAFTSRTYISNGTDWNIL